MKKVRLGFVGAGNITKNQHLKNLRKIDFAEVRAIWSRNPSKAKEVANYFNIPEVESDYRKLVTRSDIDAVVVTTANIAHHDPTVAALKAGKHVYCEKPLARNAQEARSMVKVAESCGRQLMVGFRRRYEPGLDAIKGFIDSGCTGDIYYGRLQWMRRRGIPTWGYFGDKEVQGGGCMIDLGVHVIDMALYLMGFPQPISVSAATYTKFGNRPTSVANIGGWDWENFAVEDFGSAFLRFEGGICLTIETSFAANIECDEIFNIMLLGDKGGVRLNPPTLFAEKNGKLINIAPKIGRFKMSTYARCLLMFIEAIAKAKPVPIPGSEGLITSSIVDAIYRSAKEGREVDVK